MGVNILMCDVMRSELVLFSSQSAALAGVLLPTGGPHTSQSIVTILPSHYYLRSRYSLVCSQWMHACVNTRSSVAWGSVGAANGQIVMTITESEQWGRYIMLSHYPALLLSSRKYSLTPSSSASVQAELSPWHYLQVSFLPLCPHLKLFKSDLFFSRFKCLPTDPAVWGAQTRPDVIISKSSPLSHNAGDCAPSRCDIVTLSRVQCVMSPCN